MTSKLHYFVTNLNYQCIDQYFFYFQNMILLFIYIIFISVFLDPGFVSDISYGFQERECIKKTLKSSVERKWCNVLDGDLYRDLLKADFLTMMKTFLCCSTLMLFMFSSHLEMKSGLC